MVRPFSQVNCAHTDSAKGREVTPSSEKVTSPSQVEYGVE